MDMLPVGVNVPVAGSYRSAAADEPPAISTFPLGSSVAVCPDLATDMGPAVGVHVLAWLVFGATRGAAGVFGAAAGAAGVFGAAGGAAGVAAAGNAAPTASGTASMLAAVSTMVCRLIHPKALDRMAGPLRLALPGSRLAIRYRLRPDSMYATVDDYVKL